MDLKVNHENIESVLEGLELDIQNSIDYANTIKEKLKTAISTDDANVLLNKIKECYSLYMHEFLSVESACDAFDAKFATEKLKRLTMLNVVSCEMIPVNNSWAVPIVNDTLNVVLEKTDRGLKTYAKLIVKFDVEFDKENSEKSLDILEKHIDVLNENIRALYKNKDIVENVKSFSVKISY